MTSLSDHDDLLVEHQQLASRHEELLLESEGRREGLERAWREETSRHSVQSQEQTELIIQLRNEIEKVTTAFTTQLQGLQEEHNKVSGCVLGGCGFLFWCLVHMLFIRVSPPPSSPSSNRLYAV